MNTPTIKELVIIHINYRDVFNAAVNAQELQQWLGLSESWPVKQVLKELVAEGLVETTDELNYCVAGRSEIFLHRESKRRLSRRCLRKHEKIISYLSWFPFIRFIGISGSVAAENATIEKLGYRKGSIDLDIFIITSSNALWLVFYVERLISMIFIFLLGRRYVFCFNYAMDFSFLEIHNKNIYTATELYNLKPMYDKDYTYLRLIKSNAWARKYYPSLASKQIEMKRHFKFKIREVLRYPFNLCAFYLYHFSRSAKNFSLKPLSDIKLEFNPAHRGNLKRISTPNGGYEHPVMEQFEARLKSHFSNYYRADLMQYTFPKQKKELTIEHKFSNEFNEAFNKYSIS